MSLRLEMLQVARLAPNLLGEAADLVRGFLLGQQNADGGFKDRAGNSDLYYTVFGAEALFALRAEVPADSLAPYLRSFGDGAGLDLVHVACLARCWAGMPGNLPKAFASGISPSPGTPGEGRGEGPDPKLTETSPLTGPPPARNDHPGNLLDSRTRDAILARIESHRSADGGYHASPGSEAGTLYGCFLALGAYQDLGREMPDRQGMVNCIQSLKAADGGYANQRELPMGLTPSTAAAVTLLRQLEVPIEPAVGDWLLSRAHPEGGFYATPAAPIPDLLSTATALHALSGMQRDIGDLRERTLDFLDTLWSSAGAFFGNWEDDTLDCEYTWYALLALGHLSL